MAMLMPSTTALPADGFTEVIVPSLPLSLPARTTTLSPFFSLAAILQHLRRERDDFHHAFCAKLTNNWAKDTCTYWLVGVVQDYGCVPVKADCSAIFTTDFFSGAYDDGLTDVPFFNATAWNGFLNRDNNDVAYGCVFTLGTTQYLDALNTARAAVVSNIQVGLHLDHLVSPDLLGGDACPNPRVSIILVCPKWTSRSCLWALPPSESRETRTSGPSEQYLKPQRLAALPNVWFSTLVHIR
mmetsp:Transcript_27072/g.34845  ORF Transcript_27072/g.34845 Transcript_27072/m.34845 type:complete len:241 (-) Transcript_27072:489-1211(-)